MLEIHQGTERVVMLKVYLSSDHVTPATGKTVAVVISKDGGAFANPSAGATNATEVSNGWYKVTLSTTDTNTLGDLVVRGTAADCDDPERLFAVVDSVRRGMTALPNAAAEAAGGLYTRGTGAGQINQTANGMIDANAVRWKGSVPADLTDTNKVQASVAHYTVGTAQTGDSFARLGSPAGASIAADIATRQVQIWSSAAATVNLSGTTVKAVADAIVLPTGTGAGQISLSSGAVTVGTNNDKTGYSLTQSFPANFADLAITETTGRVTVGTNADKTDYTLSTAGMQALVEVCFTYDATATYATADAGSLVKQIADNAGGSALTPEAIAEAMFTHNAGSYTTAHAGSVVKQTADNAGGSALTVQAIVDGVFGEAKGSHTGFITTLSLEASVQDVPTNAEFEARTLATASYATAANQSTIITHLTDVKGATFNGATDSLEAIRDRGDVEWITATGFSTLDAAGVRTAVGLASANLDTQIAAVKSDTAAILLDTGTEGVVVAAGSKTGYSLAATGLNLVIPADPGTTTPIWGTTSLPGWIAYFGAWSLNPVESDEDSVTLKNTAGTGDLTAYSISDNGTVFNIGLGS